VAAWTLLIGRGRKARSGDAGLSCWNLERNLERTLLLVLLEVLSQANQLGGGILHMLRSKVGGEHESLHTLSFAA
jgi:hypothetical protein